MQTKQPYYAKGQISLMTDSVLSYDVNILIVVIWVRDIKGFGGFVIHEIWWNHLIYLWNFSVGVD